MFTQKQIGNTTYWYNPSFLTEDVEAAFSVNYWKKNDAIIGSAKGRGTTWFVKGEKGEFALRHYHRGGLFGKLIKDSYWFSGLSNTRAYQELHLLQTLVQHQVNVPIPIAAKVIKSGFTYQADILVQKIANGKDLVAMLAREKLSEGMFEKIGREIRKMHDTNVNHTDLNIHNILIDNQSKVWIIDFDKCHQQEDSSWKQDNLSRLKRSFDKELGLGTIQLPDYAWKSIDNGYSKKLIGAN